MNKLVPVLGLLFAFATLPSCRRGEVYNKSKEIPVSGWHKDSVLSFNVAIPDTVYSYNILLGIKNNNEYSFSNIFLFNDIIFPDKKNIRDTVDLILSNNRGAWIGSGWFGSYKNTFALKQHIRFPLPGTYTIKVRQAMRKDVLEGIESITVIIKRR